MLRTEITNAKKIACPTALTKHLSGRNRNRTPNPQAAHETEVPERAAKARARTVTMAVVTSSANVESKNAASGSRIRRTGAAL